MDKYEKGAFVKLFNRNGYVLDFSTPDFDAFTLESVGVALCQHYGLSKGKSLNAYIQEANSNDADKLLLALFEYYEKGYGNFERETQADEFGNVALDCGVNYQPIYNKCKSIAHKYSNSGQYTSVAAQNIQKAFSSEYIDNQVKLMLSMQKDNPTEAIGKAKELIESCCKGILEEHNIAYETDWKIQRFVKEAMGCLRIMPQYIPENRPGADSIKAILNHLKTIAQNVAELRNPYGSGHGKAPGYKSLEERHAKLAVGSALTLVNFLWDSHIRVQSKQAKSNFD